MFKKILLPLDLSDRHGPAVEAAAELARLTGGAVTLLHVIEVIAGLAMAEERDFYKRLEKAARRHLEQVGDRLTKRKLPWRAELRYGNRGPEIIRYAGTAGADLVILTGRLPDPEHPGAGFASLSYQVSMFATCPVLLVK